MSSIKPASPSQIRKLKQLLADAINRALESDAWQAVVDGDLGYISEDSEYRMAEAALAVYLAQNDVQLYLQANGNLADA